MNFRETRKKALIEALTKSDGNRSQAARLLGIGLTTCKAWIDEFSLRGQFPAKLGCPFKRTCLKCGKLIRVKRIGLCVNCKRHVDFKDGDEDGYKVHL